MINLAQSFLNSKVNLSQTSCFWRDFQFVMNSFKVGVKWVTRQKLSRAFCISLRHDLRWVMANEEQTRQLRFCSRPTLGLVHQKFQLTACLRAATSYPYFTLSYCDTDKGFQVPLQSMTSSIRLKNENFILAHTRWDFHCFKIPRI